ncbi:MAG TPA: hypothetical protein PK808_08660, partial [Polymorphobacter sp.]|nr:hypothetical protein [Polymorphobacter sp.]
AAVAAAEIDALFGHVDLPCFVAVKLPPSWSAVNNRRRGMAQNKKPGTAGRYRTSVPREKQGEFRRDRETDIRPRTDAK